VGRKKQKTSEVEEAESPGVVTRSKSKQKKTDSLPERPLEVSSLHIIETYMVFLSDIQLLEFAEKLGKDADRSINSRISKRQRGGSCGNDRKRHKICEVTKVSARSKCKKKRTELSPATSVSSFNINVNNH